MTRTLICLRMLSECSKIRGMMNSSEQEPASAQGSRRLTDHISLGVLAEAFPRDLIEEVVTETGCRQQRTRRLPAHVMVRFCLAMCLFSDEDYEEVMRSLVGSLKDMDSWRDDWIVPSTSAITQARRRLTAEPLRVLFERVAGPVAGRGTKGAWLGSRRLMAAGRVHARHSGYSDQCQGVRPFG